MSIKRKRGGDGGIFLCSTVSRLVVVVFFCFFSETIRSGTRYTRKKAFDSKRTRGFQI